MKSTEVIYPDEELEALRGEGLFRITELVFCGTLLPTLSAIPVSTREVKRVDIVDFFK